MWQSVHWCLLRYHVRVVGSSPVRTVRTYGSSSGGAYWVTHGVTHWMTHWVTHWVTNRRTHGRTYEGTHGYSPGRQPLRRPATAASVNQHGAFFLEFGQPLRTLSLCKLKGQGRVGYVRVCNLCMGWVYFSDYIKKISRTKI